MVAIRPMHSRHWEYKCDCGKTIVAMSSNVINGSSKSCGCLQREKASETCIARTKSGLSLHWAGRTHAGMMRRCYSKSEKNYHRYGGRGIDVCLHLRLGGPVALLNLMQDRPHGMSIDRIDNDKGYHCGQCFECLSMGRERNVRWASQKTQMRNSSMAVHAEISGETKTLSEWAEQYGIPHQVVCERHWMGKRGLDLLKPVRLLTKRKLPA